MSIFEFLIELFDLPTSNTATMLYYVVGFVLVLIFLDGILTFLIGALQGLFYRGK